MRPERKNLRILSVVGARPNFMKVAPIIAAIEKYNRQAKKGVFRIERILVHTGQHYDEAMSDSFFRDLNLPKPDIYLGVGSASHAVQTAEIMRKFEPVLLERKPDVMLVMGDVNSTIACALVTSKVTYGVNGSRPQVAHVEAGLRSFDRSMPEETNRILTDHVSDFLFVTEKSGIRNLKREGVAQEKIHLVGNTMIDTLIAFRKAAEKSDILERLGLRKEGSPAPYGLITLHRPSNVDNQSTFRDILQALSKIAAELPLLFPCHPRTRGTIDGFGLQGYFTTGEPKDRAVLAQGINLTEPLGYIDFLCLLSNAKIVFTDSGGIQEETTCLRVPCITLRENTERPVTVTHGTNILAGVKAKEILSAFQIQRGRKIGGTTPEFWDGKAAERIVAILAGSFHP